MVVTIDGSSGSGKTSLANHLAIKLNDLKRPAVSLSSGALYRLLALKPDYYLNIDDFSIQNNQIYYLNKYFNADDYQTETLGKQASVLSQQPAIRNEVNTFMKKLIQQYNNYLFIIDGRDLSSIVFKDDALVKFYLEIDAQVSATRRVKQLFDLKQISDLENSITKIANDLQTRNDLDKTRAIAPMIKTKDAIVLNTSFTTISESVDEALGYILKALENDTKRAN